MIISQPRAVRACMGCTFGRGTNAWVTGGPAGPGRRRSRAGKLSALLRRGRRCARAVLDPRVLRGAWPCVWRLGACVTVGMLAVSGASAIGRFFLLSLYFLKF